MKGTSYFLFALVFVVGFLLLDYNFQKKLVTLREKKNPQHDQITQLKQVVPTLHSIAPRAPVATAVPSDDSEKASLEIFQKDFKSESKQIGQLQKNPDEVENRIQSLARQMDPVHIRYLAAVIADQSANGDERALAIEFLARNQTVEAMEVLKDFAKNENINLGTRPEFEMSYRAQAIESIGGMGAVVDRQAALNFLDEIKNKTTYNFLQDRAARAQNALRNNLPGFESQDNEALKKLVE